ncbi:hypothetical protein CPC08DRAFT_196706 [Agrocybe pediades]|nr:hypothetical protein CPC08DRAFT_196706 [Agrocybe pediades]
MKQLSSLAKTWRMVLFRDMRIMDAKFLMDRMRGMTSRNDRVSTRWKGGCRLYKYGYCSEGGGVRRHGVRFGIYLFMFGLSANVIMLRLAQGSSRPIRTSFCNSSRFIFGIFGVWPSSLSLLFFTTVFFRL